MCQNHTRMNDVGIIFGIRFHTEVIETKQKCCFIQPGVFVNHL